MIPKTLQPISPTDSTTEICALREKSCEVMSVNKYCETFNISAYYQGRGIGYGKALGLHHNMRVDQCMYSFCVSII